MLSGIIRFFLENRLITFLLFGTFIGWGLVTAPFDFEVPGLPRDPVAVDAIPDIGENQQIVFAAWPGRSPQDVEDQVTYPLTSALLGVPGVKSVRSNSMFGFTSIFLIFNEDIEFYWSRSRVLERLNSLPGGVLPEGVSPTLGPDATALGQVFWYTLEGRDPNTGEPLGGFDLHQLRSIQDFNVRYALSAADGVADVATVGGYLKEYQVDVDPEAMRVYGVTLDQVMRAVQNSNLDVGASTLEVNLAEYFVRGLGYIKNTEDLAQAVVRESGNVPVRLSDVARVNIGPAPRRGLLDKEGAEAVGGVVIARFGANPLAVINEVKERIALLAPGLPTVTLPDGRVSQVTVVPYYDRSGLIHETIGTLEEALTLEILVTAIVVILMLLNLRSSLLVASTLPVAVLMCFVAMRYLGVDANVVALSGIAIAIGTMVDMSIVLVESIVVRVREARPGESLTDAIHAASVEVGGAVITAVATTIVSFLPVFTMEAAEGKLFRPLAFTKTFALVAAIIVAIALLPALARVIFGLRIGRSGNGTKAGPSTDGSVPANPEAAGLAATPNPNASTRTEPATPIWRLALSIGLGLVLIYLLAGQWMPLGVGASTFKNFLFVALAVGGLIAAFWGIIYVYADILRFLLRFKLAFILLVTAIVWAGVVAFQRVGEEFMPALGEGSFLLMPTAMPHAGVQENMANLRMLDMAVNSIPEVDVVVGKAGRANTPLDPAPLSMYENLISYKSEYRTDVDGRRVRFAYDEDAEAYTRDDDGELIRDPDGRYFRQWRDHIQSPDDIWDEIIAVAQVPGVTSAPKLQPIETRLVMLQTGMRAPMGVKVYGTNLDTIEAFGLRIETALKEVSGVKDAAVFADRIVGKPYLNIEIDRAAIARYGLSIVDVQRYLQMAVGGMAVTTTVEGRERYAVRLRYPRELRDDPSSIERILIPLPGAMGMGRTVPLGQLVTIDYTSGPQSIKSEDGFLVGYVLFDRIEGTAEVEVVQAAQAYLNQQIASGDLRVPAGLSYRFAGNYEQQVRASARLAIVVPIALALIFLILYLQFKSVIVTLMVFSGVAVAFSGGFLMIGAYSTDWFLNFDLFGTNWRDLFQVHTINLSVAVWVGFLALFGIATDDGVLVATYLRESFRQNEPDSIQDIRDAVVEGGQRRVRPAMMTTATTILALLPVLTSTGRGSDIMLPMAIPSFGGMALQVLTMFTVPVLWALWRETRWRWRNGKWSGFLGFESAFGKGRASAKTILMVLASLGTTAALTVLPNGAQAQTLRDLTDTLYARNPDLQALTLDFRAAGRLGDQNDVLPELELGLGVFASPVETRVGPQLIRFSATQMLPWPGVLAARRALADARAAPIELERAASELRLRYALAIRYYEVSRLDAAVAILAQNVRLLESIEAFARSRVQATVGSTVDVYRAQLAIAEVEQRRDLLRAERIAAVARLNELLLRTPDIDMAADSLSAVIDAGSAAALLDPNAAAEGALELLQLDSLLEGLDERQPSLQVYARTTEINRRALEVSALDARPDFGFGVDYIATGRRDVPDLMGNGRDAIIPRATIRIPLNRRQYTAKIDEETFRIQAIESRLAGARARLVSEARTAQTNAVKARIRLDYLARQLALLVPAIDVATTEYSVGRRSFDELLRLQLQVYGYRLEAVEAGTQLLIARAELARILAL